MLTNVKYNEKRIASSETEWLTDHDDPKPRLMSCVGRDSRPDIDESETRPTAPFLRYHGLQLYCRPFEHLGVNRQGSIE